MSSTVSTLARRRPQEVAFAEQTVVARLDPQDDQSADHQRNRDRHRMKQVALDHRSEGQTQDDRRNECHQHVHREALRGPLAGDAHHGVDQALPVLPHDREHRAGLDRDAECRGVLSVEVEQRAGEDEVAGG
jgi:hypothetical protein